MIPNTRARKHNHTDDGCIAYKLYAYAVCGRAIVRVDWLVPQQLACWTQFSNDNIFCLIVNAIGCERKEICAVYLRPFCKLAQDVLVAFIVGSASYYCVQVGQSVIVALSNVGPHPVEVLGVGGEGQHNEHRQ